MKVKDHQLLFPFCILSALFPPVTAGNSNVGINTDQVLQTLVLLGKRETWFRLAAAAMDEALLASSRFCGCWWFLQYSWVPYQRWNLGQVRYRRICEEFLLFPYYLDSELFPGCPRLVRTVQLSSFENGLGVD